MDLGGDEKRKLKENHSRAGKIDFMEALKSVNIDLESAILKEEKWKVVNKDGKFEGCEPS